MIFPFSFGFSMIFPFSHGFSHDFPIFLWYTKWYLHRMPFEIWRNFGRPRLDATNRMLYWVDMTNDKDGRFSDTCTMSTDVNGI